MIAAFVRFNLSDSGGGGSGGGCGGSGCGSDGGSSFFACSDAGTVLIIRQSSGDSIGCILADWPTFPLYSRYLSVYVCLCVSPCLSMHLSVCLSFCCCYFCCYRCCS